MRRILIVEDESHIRELLRLLLQSEGHETLQAATVKDALELIQNEAPDLVILDLVLGRDDGRDVFRKARAHATWAPFLIVSAYGARTAARELGAEGWVEKPFDVVVLLREVSRLLSST